MALNKQKTSDFSEKLSGLGLSEKERTVYSALLEFGGAFPSQVAEVTKLNRSTAYTILTDLAVKGLILELRRRNKIFYQVEKPQKLIRFAKDRIRLAEEGLEKTQKILPEIEGLFSLLPNKPRIRFFEGFPEVLSVHEDHISGEEKYEMLAWANANEIIKFLPAKLVKEYLKKKENLGITTRAIVPNTSEDRRYNEKNYRYVSKKIWVDLRFVQAKKFPQFCEITIYGKNKVSILNFGKETPIGVIIEDQTIHDVMAMIFELSWKGTRK
jgi:sugar-specific transcriptional regulator TrmB